MARTAKLFRNGRSQAVRLPAEFRFEGQEVFIRRDEKTGDVILSKRPESWEEFFSFLGMRPAKLILGHLRNSWPSEMIKRRRSVSCSDDCALFAGHQRRQLRDQKKLDGGPSSNQSGDGGTGDFGGDRRGVALWASAKRLGTAASDGRTVSLGCDHFFVGLGGGEGVWATAVGAGSRGACDGESGHDDRGARDNARVDFGYGRSGVCTDRAFADGGLDEIGEWMKSTIPRRRYVVIHNARKRVNRILHELLAVLSSV
jgi:antitoxin VapB